MVNFPELEVLEIFQETGRANISFQEASGSGCVDELLFFFFLCAQSCHSKYGNVG